MPTVPFIIEKFRGMKNVGRPQKSGKGQFQEVFNADIDNDEVIRLRSGSRTVYPGAVGGLVTDGIDLLFREGTALKRLESNGTATTLRSGFGSVIRPIASVTIHGKTYFSDGDQMGVYQDRRVRTWGLETPPAPQVSPTVGDLLPGGYLVALTYRRNDGQESGSSPSVLAQAPDGGFRMSVLPSSDPDVDGIRIYVSTSDGGYLRRQGTMPNEAATFTISGGLLTGGIRLRNMHKRAPLPGEHICFYRGRCYIASGSVVRCTEPLNYELISLDRSPWPFQANVRMMLPVENGIWVGTKDEVSIMYGERPMKDGGFQIRSRNACGVIPGAYEIVESSILPLKGLPPGPVAIWLSKDGVFAGDGLGNIFNLTGNYFVPPESEEGWAAFVKDNGMDRIIFGLKTSGVASGSGRVRILAT